MYPASFDTPHHVPLDFDTPRHTDSVADALVSEPALEEGPRVSAPESLLSELGLSGHVARAIVAERSGPGGQG